MARSGNIARLVGIVAALMMVAGCTGPDQEPAPEPDQAAAQDVEAEEPRTDEDDAVGESELPSLPEVALPANFPDSIPLYDGPVTYATEMLMGGDWYAWTIHVRAVDGPAAIAEVREQLVAAGFPETAWTEVGEMQSGVFRTDEYRISVQTAADINGHMLLYTVNEEKQEG